MDHLLSLDVGTTSVKAALFTLDGRLVSVVSEDYALETPGPDRVELDPEVYWRCACSGIRGVLAAAGVGGRSVRSIGVCSQGETFVLLDADGGPVRKAIVWLDNRAASEATELGATLDGENPTGQTAVSPTWPATKLLWLRRNEPRSLERARHLFLVEDYLVYRLTGSRSGEYSLYSSSFLLDVQRKEWWSRVLEIIGIDRTILPELHDPGVIVGTLRPAVAAELGLSPECRVVSGAMDQNASMLGAGSVGPGIVTETTGTAQVVCGTLGRFPEKRPEGLAVQCHALPGAYLLIGWLSAAGISLQWLRDTAASAERAEATASGRSPYEIMIRDAASVAPGSDGLFFFPFMSGPGTLPHSADLRGVYYGLQLSHDRRHLVRALLESLAYTLREQCEIMGRAGLEIAEIRALGGGAKSELWNQIKADVLGVPLSTMESPESGALGVAMLEAVALGSYASLAEAASVMVHLNKRFEPTPSEARVYGDKYAEYRRLLARLSESADR